MMPKSLRSCVPRLSIGQCLLKQDQPVNCIEFYIKLFVELNDECHDFDAAKLLSTRFWGCVPFWRKFHGNIFIYTYLILETFLVLFFAKGVHPGLYIFIVLVTFHLYISMLNMILVSTLKAPHIIVSPRAPEFSGPALCGTIIINLTSFDIHTMNMCNITFEIKQK